MEKARQYTALGLALASLLVVGCIEERAVPMKGEVPKPDPKSISWSSYSERAEHPYHQLAYGAPESDYIYISLRCRDGEAAFKMSVSSDPPDWTIRLRSGDLESAYMMIPNTDDQFLLEGTPGLSDPLLRAFLKSGDLSIWDGKGWISWDADTPEEDRAVKNFAQRCGLP